MAKHELGDQTSNDFDFDTDIDFNSDDFGYEGDEGSVDSSGNKRKPTLRSRLGHSFTESWNQLKGNNEFKRQALKQLLPSEYSSTIDMADTASYEISSVWRQQEREWDKHRGEVKKLVKNYGDILDKVGLKKLHTWAQQDERGSTSAMSEAEIDELKVKELMGEDFAANEQADRESQGKLTTETNEQLKQLNQGFSRQTSYNEKIDYTFKRKSLELSARQLIIQQRTFELLKVTQEQNNVELKGIHHNTGLPDYVKTNTYELAQRTIKQQILSGATAPFNGSAKALFGKIKQRFGNKMGEFWNDIGGHIRNINMSVEDEEYSGGTASSRLGDMGMGLLTDAILKKPAEKILGKIAPKVRQKLEEQYGISLAGNKLDTFMRQAGNTLNVALKSHDTGFKTFDFIKDKFDLASAAFSANHTVRDESRLNLEEAGKITRKFTLTVEEVIPALLKRINTTIFTHFNPNTQPEDLHWNYKNNEFENINEVRERTLKKIYKKDRILSEHEKLENLINTIDPDQTLSAGLRKEIGLWLKEEKRNSNDCNPLNLLATNTPLSKKHLAEYTLFAEHEFGLTEEDIVRLGGGTFKDMQETFVKSKSPKLAQRRARIADAYTDYQRTNGVDIAEVEKLMRDTTQLKVLEKAGVVFRNDEGVYQYSYGLLDSISDQIGNFTRENEKIVMPYRPNTRIKLDREGRTEKTDELDSNYDYKDSVLKYGANAKYAHPWLFQTDQAKKEKDVSQRHDRLDGEAHRNSIYAGNDYYIDRNGGFVLSGDKRFNNKTRQREEYLKLSEEERKKIESQRKRSRSNFGYASGGEIESFAKGGETKPKEPDQEQQVKVHGGEYVVDSKATQKNKELLEAINKLGAPLFTASGEINRVYYKLLGFKTAKEMDVKGQAGKLKQAVKEGYLEHNEDVISSLISNIATSESNKKDLDFIKNKENQPKQRLVKAVKLFKSSQVEAMKADPKGYAKNLAAKGIDVVNSKIDSLIDPDKTGENVEIKNAVIKAVKAQASGIAAVGRRGVKSSKEYVGSKILQHRVKNINRVETLKNVDKTKTDNIAKGSAYLHKAVDIYMVGNKSPVLLRLVFNGGGYFDEVTGESINSPDKITGTVLNSRGDVVVTIDQLLSEEFYIKLKGGMTKDFKFVGLDTFNVSKKSYNKMFNERLDLVKQSEKYKKIKDTVKKVLVDDAIDIYLRGDENPTLTAKGFKEAEYFDKETGNVLWTHHDIMGVVVDQNSKVLITKEDLENGLFDKDGNHIKINKFKQVRNIVFKRGGEIYKKHLSKHVNKYAGGALDWMSSVGEHTLGMNFDDKPIDVYIKGEDRPAITAYMFGKGIVRDINSGNVLKSHSGISGPVINTNNPLTSIISQDQIDNKMLVDASGEELYLPLLKTKKERFMGYLGEAFLPKKTFGAVRDIALMSPEKRKEKVLEQIKNAKVAYDVYVKGAPLKPILTKEGFEKGEYVSRKTGKPIHIPEMIDGPVVGPDGNTILNEEQLKTGLCDFKGNNVKVGFNLDEMSLANFVGATTVVNKIRQSRANKIHPNDDSDKMTDIFIKGEKEPILKLSEIESGKYYVRGTSKNVKTYADILKGVVDENGNTVIGDKELKKGLVNINGTSIATLGSLSGVIKNKFNKLRANSWEMIREKMLGKKKDEKEKTPKEKEKKEKHSWLGKLIPALGVLFGGVTTTLLKLKSKFLSSFAWLGQVFATKSLGNGLGGFIGRGRGGKLATRAAMVGGLYGVGKMVEHYSADDEKFTDVDPNSYGGMDTTNRVMMAGTMAEKHLNDPKKEEPGMIKKFLSSDAGQLALSAFLMGGGLGKVGKLGLGGLNLAGRGIANAGLWGAKKAAKLAGRGTVSVATRAPGMAGKLARGVGKVAKGSLNLTSLFRPMSLLRGAGWLARGALGLVSGPVLGLTALAVAGYYAYKFTKNFLNDKKNPWNRFRMAQYGFDHNDDGVVDKISKLEQVTQTMIQFDTKGNPLIKSDEKAMNEILKICGFKDEQGQDIPDEKERMSNFALWFKARFLRVFTSYLRYFKEHGKKPEMLDITKLKKDEQLGLLTAVHFTGLANSPYLIQASPFKDPDECKKEPRDVNVLFTKIGMAIKMLPDDVNVNVKKEENKDGIGGDVIPKPADKKSSVDKKIEVANTDLANKEAKKLDTKGNVKDTVDVVTYQAKQMEKIAELHNENIRKQTDKTIEESNRRMENQKAKEENSKKPYGGSGGGGVMDAIGDKVRYALTNKVSQEMTTNETAKMAGGQKDRQVQVYEAFISAGFSENQARALTAEVGRENSYSDKELFGSHTDPKSKVVNTGMISWNDTRRAKLLSFLGARGLVDNSGNIQKSQDGLNAQAEFIMDEMKNGAFKGKLDDFLYRPDIDYKTAAYLLGTKYIKWAYRDAKYKSGHDNRDRFYNSLSEQISQGKTSAAKKQGLATLAKTPTDGRITRDEVQTVTFAKKAFYFGDSIAEGYKKANLGEGYTEVGADPKKVKNLILGFTVFKEPSNYRNQIVYLSTGISNNPTQMQVVAEQLQRLRELGVNVKVFGVSTTLPNADGNKLNIMLQSLCTTYKMEFLGGFKAGKDNIHPESYKSLGVVKTTTQNKEVTKPSEKPKANAVGKAANVAFPSSGLKLQSLADYSKSVTESSANAHQTQVDHASSSWNVDAIVNHALQNATKDPAKSKGQCALFVRRALQAGDKNKIIKGGLGDARDFLVSLPKIGWNRIGDKSTVTPQKGDVCVFPPYKDASGKLHPVGHVCLFTGSQWVSDFYQKTMYPSSLKQDLPHSLFRANGIVSKGNAAAYVEPASETKDVQMANAQPSNKVNTTQQPQVVDTSKSNVSSKMEDINKGRVVQTSPQTNNVVTQQEAPSINTSSMEGILNKQLTVQEQSLGILKDILKAVNTNGVSTAQQANSSSSAPNNSQQQNGLSTPNLSGVLNQRPNEFKNVGAPFSVKKELK